jgi:hypothetical protein
MAELIPSVLFPSLIDKRYFLFHPNLELIPRPVVIWDQAEKLGATTIFNDS